MSSPVAVAHEVRRRAVASGRWPRIEAVQGEPESLLYWVHKRAVVVLGGDDNVWRCWLEVDLNDAPEPWVILEFMNVPQDHNGARDAAQSWARSLKTVVSEA